MKIELKNGEVYIKCKKKIVVEFVHFVKFSELFTRWMEFVTFSVTTFLANTKQCTCQAE